MRKKKKKFNTYMWQGRAPEFKEFMIYRPKEYKSRDSEVEELLRVFLIFLAICAIGLPIFYLLK